MQQVNNAEQVEYVFKLKRDAWLAHQLWNAGTVNNALHLLQRHPNKEMYADISDLIEKGVITLSQAKTILDGYDTRWIKVVKVNGQLTVKMTSRTY